MPMHDWTRVSTGVYHDFRSRWLAEIANRLNGGVLPADHYARMEQMMEALAPDVLSPRSEVSPPPEATDVGPRGLAVAAALPRVRFIDSIETDVYAAKTLHIAIRQRSDDRVVALVELISPWNKAGDHATRAFLDKAITALLRGYHLLLIDPFPSQAGDPGGIHGAIWSELGGHYEPPPGKPLTLAAYSSGAKKTAYVEPFAVKDVLTAMPLFLRPDWYVLVPLEESYRATYQGIPLRYRCQLEQLPS